MYDILNAVVLSANFCAGFRVLIVSGGLYACAFERVSGTSEKK